LKNTARPGACWIAHPKLVAGKTFQRSPAAKSSRCDAQFARVERRSPHAKSCFCRHSKKSS
jgi:hypothetical protein